MKIAIVNYGMGNIGSVRRALTELGADATPIEDPAKLDSADRIVLPGVGSFGDAMRNLVQRGWREELRRQVLDKGKPLLGICLGMQLLASRGTEDGESAGLDLVPGAIIALRELGCALRVPHVGWNSIASLSGHAFFSGIPTNTDFYFVHSFGFRPDDERHVIARTEYGISIVAAVGNGNVMGAQYHPEKSAKAGFRQLKNFLDFRPC
jgi:glutamine amidotransferase